MTAQLLIEMPAEGAARLITLSLLEQLSQYAATSAANGDGPHPPQHVAPYRAAVRRLRACLMLYADALGDSVPRKARRRLRELGDAAERLHRADVQLTWLARRGPAPGTDTAGLPGDGARAAIWLSDRIVRRRQRALRALLRTQRDVRPLRRIAKRLGVYTTAVRLDAEVMQQSFARMTSDQLLIHTDALGSAMRTTSAAISRAELRRALQAVEHVAYLLEPLRTHADVEALSERVTVVRAALERLHHTIIVGRAIVRGGRRVGALHAAAALQEAIWGLSPPVANGRPPATPADLQRGLLVLAESLHDEVARSLEALTASWEQSGADEFIERLVSIAAQLQG